MKTRLARMGTLEEQDEEITLPHDGNITALPLGRGREGWGDSRLCPAPKKMTRSLRHDFSTRALVKLATCPLLGGTVSTSKTVPAP